MAKKTKLNGDNYPHTNMMTLDEWKAFAANFPSKLACKNYLHIARHSCFDGTFGSSLIGGAFRWNLTKEGYNYWRIIFERTRPVS